MTMKMRKNFKRGLLAAGALSGLLFATGLIAEERSVTDLVQTCAACHGKDGISPLDNSPHLAGQQAGYLATQLKAFREGKRSDPLMTAAAKGLSDRETKALADYYANMDSKVLGTQENPGGAGQHVSARCVACHGMRGRTVNQEWPNIAGQKRSYIVKQLQQYRDGSRASIHMAEIAKELTDQQIEDVAEFYSQLD
jgi:cytochrome c553